MNLKYTIISAVIAISLTAGAVGCHLFPVRAASPVDGRPVTESELRAEVEAFRIKAEAAAQSIKERNEVREAIKNATIGLANSFVPPGYQDIATGVFAVIAAGASIDNVRKRSKPADEIDDEVYDGEEVDRG